MTGIVVGLGGTAAHTNRAQSLRGLVREGCPSATVTVCLRNSGCDAFQEGLFGKCIIVERKITAEGVGGHYRIRNHEGKVVSSKKEDLLQILDHFNIQVRKIGLMDRQTDRQTSKQKCKSPVKVKKAYKSTKNVTLQYFSCQSLFSAGMSAGFMDCGIN
jgi:hypothetical protein